MPLIFPHPKICAPRFVRAHNTKERAALNSSSRPKLVIAPRGSWPGPVLVSGEYPGPLRSSSKRPLTRRGTRAARLSFGGHSIAQRLLRLAVEEAEQDEAASRGDPGGFVQK